ncbi:NtaA/DmoA family FMN-dependent monooxygenase [Pseudonocardia pini]|uniref:NtaA/DmoA family FMN-dependent monooxygenase n=1 Tax=Pseudonocardia pini TaxID=2758030 RepID=UPI0015F066A8|nr:NtaA/DmoA family FMN-dependent monooxygenase [Pseudonocardia pini]
MFHLGWFIGNGFGVQSWGQTWSGEGGTEWKEAQLYIDHARAMERAGFDFMMFEDSSMVPDQYGGSMDAYLASAIYSPKHDPVPMLSAVGISTSRIGVVGTIATPFYHPFMAARSFATIDNMIGGRAGINLVTSSNNRAAQNYGLDTHIEHDHRYAMAHEWVDCLTRLWGAWDPDSVVLDEANGIFADGSKVRTVDFKGEYYSSRGPLNVIPSPQGRPAICQAGGSAVGREFGARWSDVVMSNVQGGPGRMKAYRDDVLERAVVHGRKPSDVKVMFLINPTLGETDEEAHERYRRKQEGALKAYEKRLISMSVFTGVDFSTFDPDEPLPAITTNGHQSNTADMRMMGEGKTLRELAADYDLTTIAPLVGSPDTVAGQLQEIYEHVGGDGFLVASTVNRRTVAEITDGLVPALRRRGLTRTGYTYEHLRDNLLEF